MIRKFLLFCSGAKLSILLREDCSLEQNKYEMIGLTIFFTAVLASLSGGYALFAVFQSLPLSSAFGILWGAIILNLDRFIVSNIKKEKNNLFEQIIGAFPRLILAIFLAIVITKPLELRLFAKEIDAEIIKQNEYKLRNDRLEIAKEQSENKQIVALKEEKSSLNYEIKNEVEGKISDYLSRNPPDTTGEVDRLRRLGVEKNQRLNEVNSQIDEINKQYEVTLQRAQYTQQNSKSLLTQLVVIEKLALEDKMIHNVNLFITLMFIALEISPVIVKILSRYSIYDAILENEEETIIYKYTKKTDVTKEIINQEFSSHQDMQIHLKNVDIDKGAESYQNMRIKFQDFINKQFLKSLENTLESPRYLGIQNKIIQEIIGQTEKELMKYAKGIQLTGSEIAQTLDKITSEVLEGKLTSKVERSTAEARVENFLKDVDKLSKYSEDESLEARLSLEKDDDEPGKPLS